MVHIAARLGTEEPDGDAKRSREVLDADIVPAGPVETKVQVFALKSELADLLHDPPRLIKRRDIRRSHQHKVSDLIEESHGKLAHTPQIDHDPSIMRLHHTDEVADSFLAQLLPKSNRAGRLQHVDSTRMLIDK